MNENQRWVNAGKSGTGDSKRRSPKHYAQLGIASKLAREARTLAGLIAGTMHIEPCKRCLTKLSAAYTPRFETTDAGNRMQCIVCGYTTVPQKTTTRAVGVWNSKNRGKK